MHTNYKLKTNSKKKTTSGHQAQYLDLKWSLRANIKYKNDGRLNLQLINNRKTNRFRLGGYKKEQRLVPQFHNPKVAKMTHTMKRLHAKKKGEGGGRVGRDREKQIDSDLRVTKKSKD